MKYGISSLFGPGLVGALLLGSGCVIVTEDGQDGPAGQPPRIVMDIDMPNGGSCTVVSGGQVRTCESAMTANSQATVDVVVDWGSHAPGALEIDDDCRGTLQLVSRDVRVLQATWQSPAEQGSCQVTARARSGDGVRTELSVVVRVEGDGPELGYPRLSVKLSHGNGTCILPVGQSTVTCSAPVQAGDVVQASVQVDWGDQTQSEISVSPACSSEFVEPVDENGAFTTAWLTSLLSEDDCTVLVEAVSQEGAIVSGKLSFSIVEGQAPGE